MLIAFSVSKAEQVLARYRKGVAEATANASMALDGGFS